RTWRLERRVQPCVHDLDCGFS
ncbi:hypothetical protein L195_g064689, partial [Trifolium pratense]